MPIRTFTLNSREFHEAVCEPRERPWIPNGALPREPRWPRGESRVWVNAATDAKAEDAVRAWLGHVEAGREWAARVEARSLNVSIGGFHVRHEQ